MSADATRPGAQACASCGHLLSLCHATRDGAHLSAGALLSGQDGKATSPELGLVLSFLCLHELADDVGIWQMTCDSRRSSAQCFLSCPVDDGCDPCRSSVGCTIIAPLSKCDLFRSSVGYTFFE
jgi:hypothetical protein